MVHFTKSLFLFFFVAYRAATILVLASSTLLYMSFAVALSVHQELSEHLKLSRCTLQEYRKPIIDGKSEMTDTPDTIASKRTKGNDQSLVVPLCSLYSF
jgi:hypothetical protein